MASPKHRDTSDEGLFGFDCECGFTSTGWSTKAARDRRRRAHQHEHETGEPMPELADAEQ